MPIGVIFYLLSYILFYYLSCFIYMGYTLSLYIQTTLMLSILCFVVPEKKKKKGPTIFEYKESKVEYKDCKSLQDAFQNYPIYIRRVKLSSTNCKLRKISKPNQKPFSERINSSCRANNSFACKVNFKD